MNSARPCEYEHRCQKMETEDHFQLHSPQSSDTKDRDSEAVCVLGAAETELGLRVFSLTSVGQMMLYNKCKRLNCPKMSRRLLKKSG